MEGIALAEGGTARRKLGAVPEEVPEIVKAVRARRNLEALVEKPLGSLCQPEQLLAQIGPALAAMPDDQAAAAALAIADQFAQPANGRWPAKRTCSWSIVIPLHPLTRNAYRWLIRHNSSSEARRRTEIGQFLLVTTTEPQCTPSRAVPRHVQKKRPAPVLGDSPQGGPPTGTRAPGDRAAVGRLRPGVRRRPDDAVLLAGRAPQPGRISKAQEWYSSSWSPFATVPGTMPPPPSMWLDQPARASARTLWPCAGKPPIGLSSTATSTTLAGKTSSHSVSATPSARLCRRRRPTATRPPRSTPPRHGSLTTRSSSTWPCAASIPRIGTLPR